MRQNYGILNKNTNRTLQNMTRLTATLGLGLCALTLGACSSLPGTKESHYPHVRSQVNYDTPFEDWHTARHGASPFRQHTTYTPPMEQIPDYSYKTTPTFVDYNNKGVHPERERWWVNRAVGETKTGDRMTWHIDEYEYQFRADSDPVKHHSTWRACRRGALLSRISQFEPWQRKEGTFCKTREGNWQHAGY